MEVIKPRQTQVKIVLDKKDITQELSDFIIEIVYTDSIEEKAKDELQLTISNPDRRFLKYPLPVGGKLKASVIYNNTSGKQEEFFLGTFFIGDEFTAKTEGSILTLKATSQSHQDLDALKSIRNEAYENITLKDLVTTIINKAQKNPLVDVPEINIKRIDITNQSYENFLKQLAKKYGCRFFIRSKTIVFTKELKSREINLTSYLIDDQIRYKAKQEVGVKFVEMLYYEPNSKYAQLYREAVPGVNQGKTVRIQDIARNIQEAREKVRAYMKNLKTSAQAEGTFTIYGQPVNAGDTLIVPKEKYGFLGGKYTIVKAVHSIKKDEGWKTNLEIKIGG